MIYNPRIEPHRAQELIREGHKKAVSVGDAAIVPSLAHVIRNDGVGGSNPSCGTSKIKHLDRMNEYRSCC
jgi:hypothetical protein